MCNPVRILLVTIRTDGKTARRSSSYRTPDSMPTAGSPSAAERVADCRAHVFEGGVIELTDVHVEGGLRDGVQSVAVDDGWSIEAHSAVVDRDFRCQTSGRGRDLRDRDEGADVEHLAAGEDENRASLATNLGQPHLPSIHSSPQASASAQDSSTFSGRAR
jgi:hypothetical protein